MQRIFTVWRWQQSRNVGIPGAYLASLKRSACRCGFSYLWGSQRNGAQPFSYHLLLSHLTDIQQKPNSRKSSLGGCILKALRVTTNRNIIKEEQKRIHSSAKDWKSFWHDLKIAPPTAFPLTLPSFSFGFRNVGKRPGEFCVCHLSLHCLLSSAFWLPSPPSSADVI